MEPQKDTQVQPDKQSPAAQPDLPAPEPKDGATAGDGGSQVVMPPGALREVKDRAGRKAVNDFLESLGLTDIDALKATLEDGKKLARDKQTEQERVSSDLETARSENAELKQKIAEHEQATLEAQKQLSQQRIDTAILTAAKDAKRPEDVLLWARGSKEHFDKLLDDDHNIVADNVTALIDACKQARPEWFGGRTPGSPSNAGAKPPQSKIDKQKILGRTSY